MADNGVVTEEVPTTMPLTENKPIETNEAPIVSRKNSGRIIATIVHHYLRHQQHQLHQLHQLHQQIAPASLTQTAAGDASVATAAIVSHGAQVKQGLGPELPRPNPVRLPTRRELLWYSYPITT